MDFRPALESGILLRRYKRFLADIVAEDGETLTIHCPNTGAMTGCDAPGSRIWFSRSANTARKYPHTLELVESHGDLVGVNSARANAVVGEALEARRIPELDGVSLKREADPPDDTAVRFDFRIDFANRDACFVEVKSVTLSKGNGLGAFPEAKSARALRHVEALTRVRASGYGAVLLFCVHHNGIERVMPADTIDPDYG